jgi:hypothetical protein
VWECSDSPRLSTVLDAHKAGTAKNREARYSTVSDVQAVRDDDTACKAEIRAWARSVHTAWASEHEKVLPVVRRFLATLL